MPFQLIFQVVILSFLRGCWEYNCSSGDLGISTGTKKGYIAAKKYVKHLFKVINRFITYLMLIYVWNWDRT